VTTHFQKRILHDFSTTTQMNIMTYQHIFFQIQKGGPTKESGGNWWAPPARSGESRACKCILGILYNHRVAL